MNPTSGMRRAMKKGADDDGDEGHEQDHDGFDDRGE